MRRSTALFIACSLLGALSFVNESRADGRAVASCDTSAPSFRLFGAIFHSGTEPTTFHCEADPKNLAVGEVQPRPGMPGVVVIGQGAELTRLIVLDQHPTQDITCRLIAEASDGTFFFSNPTSSSGVGQQNIAGDLELTPGGPTNARLFVECMVPGVAPNGAFSGIAAVNTTPIGTLF